jgi:hypothetical protein
VVSGSGGVWASGRIFGRKTQTLHHAQKVVVLKSKALINFKIIERVDSPPWLKFGSDGLTISVRSWQH